MSKVFMRGWCFGVVFFIAIVVLEYFQILGDSLALALAVCMALSVVVAVLTPMYLMRTVRCPNCNRSLKTQKNREIDRLVAICEECEIEWNLNIGIDTD